MDDSVIEMAVKAYTLMLPYYEVVLAITVFFFLPLAVWHKTRNVACVGLHVMSCFFGFSAWLLGAAVTFGTFGWIGLIIGLLGLGFGMCFSVVPIAIIGAIYKLDNSGLALGIFVMLLVTRAFRYSGVYVRLKAAPFVRFYQ